MFDRFGAKVFIRRKNDGKYLMLTSGDWPERPDRSHKADLPGGIVEAGETTQQGAVREVFEETGIRIAEDNLSEVYKHTSIHNDAHLHVYIYVTELEEDREVTLSWEHEAYAWMSLDEMSSIDIRAPYPSIFAELRRSNKLA